MKQEKTFGTTIDVMKGEGRSMGNAKFKNPKDVTNYTYVYIYTYTYIMHYICKELMFTSVSNFSVFGVKKIRCFKNLPLIEQLLFIHIHYFPNTYQALF